MRKNGFTLIELIVVIIVVGILASIAVPKYIDFSGNAKTTTLEAIKGSIDGGMARVYGKSVVAGNHQLPFAPNANTALAFPRITLDGQTVAVNYGYPLGSNSEWQKIITFDRDVFTYTASTDSSRLIIYPKDQAVPSNINEDCIVYYLAATGTTKSTSAKVGMNPCL
ncbi:prepilin-type N-terminal cleavage/methylation domain-containing protein [Thalassotalea sp. 1_MG-2023]|uniref:prepilin-type N-terminal cleavage/methylation domain-containing protein n=1 Tax=Thalassotalea sp. 1_MG-2023 TaxID=3062680 RepID=UPI0026E32720|nr:prepilin-type N-terminal cleavage/methylation domain-containing protein [Thalassotalea sp. 1_MG-2023]MDO6426299.1 prepilin-type N-terminal cleavage/methylation domain-containing protein [Thalassotalea sp. 1_MG-2023]